MFSPCLCVPVTGPLASAMSSGIAHPVQWIVWTSVVGPAACLAFSAALVFLNGGDLKALTNEPLCRPLFDAVKRIASNLTLTSRDAAVEEGFGATQLVRCR